MIISNGAIEIKSIVSGGIDPETGYPLDPKESSWSEPIPCQLSANKYDKLGISDGEHFTIAQYTILIEELSQPMAIERIRLKDLSGNQIGEFSVSQVEPLDAVCELRIIV